MLCTVPDEVELRHWAGELSEKKIRRYVFFEDDLGNQATALATEPIQGEARRLFRKLPLWVPKEVQTA